MKQHGFKQLKRKEGLSFYLIGFNKSNSLWKEKPVIDSPSVPTRLIEPEELKDAAGADILKYNILSPMNSDSNANSVDLRDSSTLNEDPLTPSMYNDFMVFVSLWTH